MRTGLLGLLAIAALTLSSASVASADDLSATLSPDIEYALAHEPGGVLISPDTVEWPELGMTLRVASPVHALAVGTCASGSICAYTLASGSGSMLSWSSCGSHSTSALSTVGSIANGRSSGSLSALVGSTVRATAAAGARTNVPTTYTKAITSVSC